MGYEGHSCPCLHIHRSLLQKQRILLDRRFPEYGDWMPYPCNEDLRRKISYNFFQGFQQG